MCPHSGRNSIVLFVYCCHLTSWALVLDSVAKLAFHAAIVPVVPWRQPAGRPRLEVEPSHRRTPCVLYPRVEAAPLPLRGSLSHQQPAQAECLLWLVRSSMTVVPALERWQ